MTLAPARPSTATWPGLDVVPVRSARRVSPRPSPAGSSPPAVTASTSASTWSPTRAADPHARAGAAR